MKIEISQTAQSAVNHLGLFAKCVLIFGMALALWLPTNIILELVRERESRQREAVTDISSKWGGRQMITGPVIMLPYETSLPDSLGRRITRKQYAYIMPDKLVVDAKVNTEKRYRGIYEVPVFKTQVKLSGTFKPIDWTKLNITPDQVIWAESGVLFSTTDRTHGINEDLLLKWNGKDLVFNPESNTPQFPEALNAAADLSAVILENQNSFAMAFDINGSEQFLVSPIARENQVRMESAWRNPGFTGIKLPDTREVNETGFNASWKYMNRTFPLVWNNTTYDFSKIAIGTNLLIPVDSYDKTERAVKYALLCIILTFAAFFLIESIYKKPLHLVHYGLAGIALVLFYTLLLSISEYTGFNLAYMIAGTATIGLVAWFVGSIMRSIKLALFISFVLTVVYTYIFTIIQLEDYSLLMGSIGLFIALGIIMFFSRKLQWYNRPAEVSATEAA